GSGFQGPRLWPDASGHNAASLANGPRGDGSRDPAIQSDRGGNSARFRRDDLEPDRGAAAQHAHRGVWTPPDSQLEGLAAVPPKKCHHLDVETSLPPGGSDSPPQAEILPRQLKVRFAPASSHVVQPAPSDFTVA